MGEFIYFIFIDKNRIGDKGAISIANALKNKKSIREFKIGKLFN